MKKFSIEYNPYMVNTIYKKNDNILNENNRIGKKSGDRLQVWLSPNINWKGLVEEIVDECNDKQIELTFSGRKIDYEDLYACVKSYKGDTEFDLIAKFTQNDEDIIAQFDRIISDISDGPVEELRNPQIMESYNQVKNGIFEVSVIATMSSGKSTLINSFLGSEILPSKNEACTATVVTILDVDGADNFEATCYDEKGNLIYDKKVVTPEDMLKYNEDSKVTYIEMEGDIPAVYGEKMKLCINDTPGPNNSETKAHGKLTTTIIEEKENSVILYVLNATQLQINDDEALLKQISEEMKKVGKQSRDRFLFVINKCDALDEQKGESVEKIVVKVKNYLAKFGIKEPNIYPVSAIDGLVARKVQNGMQLTRFEDGHYSNLHQYIKYQELHFDKYATLSPSVREKINQKLEMFKQNGDRDNEALIHTGIPIVEEAIMEYIDKYAYPIKIKNSIKDIQEILNELEMIDKLEKKILSSSEELDKVKAQIENAKVKRDSGKKISDDYIMKIHTYKLPQNACSDEKRKVEQKLNRMTEPFDGKVSIDKNESDSMISKFEKDLVNFQKSYESELRLYIQRNIYDQGQIMLNEYTDLVDKLKDDIKINSFDFNKIREYSQHKFKNIDQLVKRNESDRIRKEKYWVKNPEREGVLGFFKVWKPKEVQREREVIDGVNVNVKNIIQTIMNDCSSATKKNIDATFAEAEKEIKRYIERFEENIKSLNKAIDKIIGDLEEKIQDKDKLEKEVDDNKDKMLWVKNKIMELSKVMEFKEEA